MKQLLYKYFMKVFHEELQVEFDRVKRETRAEHEQHIKGVQNINRAISYESESLKNTVLKLKQDLALKDWELKKLQEMLEQQQRKPEEQQDPENLDKLVEELYN
jgi:hypothetical protein